jgi:hypothetical protein
LYLEDDEYSELQQFMMQNPEAGRSFVVQAGFGNYVGCGRGWASVRIIYFLRYEPNEFWMLTIYAKAKHDNVPAHILKRLVEEFQI